MRVIMTFLCSRLGSSFIVVAIAALAFSMLIPVPRIYAASTQTYNPEKVDVNELLLNASKNDNALVKVVGEAVGDLMVRGEYAWVNVLDSSGTAIGVWVPTSEARKVQSFGEYSRKGDTIEVTGVFHSACPFHGGDPDVHAESVLIVDRGTPTSHLVSPQRVRLGVTAVALAAVAGLALQRKQASGSR